MNIHDATEVAYKNGFKAGYQAGVKEFAAELYNNLRQYENYDTHHTYEILDRIESVDDFLLNNLAKELAGDPDER